MPRLQFYTREQKRAMLDASALVGGLSNTSKMPSRTRTGADVCTGSSYSTSAYLCRTGSKLRRVKGSVCSSCYACKGRQAMPSVQASYTRRTDAYNALGADAWIDAMARSIAPDADFRFFDSGDLADYGMLLAIVKLAKLRPDVRFWVPTKEYADVMRLRREQVQVPANLCLRVSAPMLDAELPASYGKRSAVYTDASKVPAGSHVCPCSTGERTTCDGSGEQDACRACWLVEQVIYLKH